MLDFQIAKQYMYDEGYGDRNHSPAKIERARHMFHRSFVLGKIRRWYRRLSGQDSAILELDALAQELLLRHRWSAGLHAIEMENIIGTIGRADDFDRDFAPLQPKSETRWVEVAVARFNGTPIAPIRVVQVNRVYFVVDGHHRVSVAKALGEWFIEAEITIWD